MIIFFYKDLTRNITLLTHSHAQAVQGAILQSYAVQLALKTQQLDVDTYLQELTRKMQTLEQEHLESKQKNNEDAKNEEMESGDSVRYLLFCLSSVKLSD